MSKSVNKFAVKTSDGLYCRLDGPPTANILEATLYNEKLAVVEGNKMVMIRVTYDEYPWELE